MQTVSRRRWLLAYAPLVIWIAVIIGLGSGIGSMNETSRIIRPLLEFLFPTSTPETLTLIHGYIRKFAHLAEYAVLGILACRAFAVSRNWVVPTAALVVAVASIDEIKQSFDPTRTGSGWDVALDTFGGFIGAALFWIRSRRRGNRTYTVPEVRKSPNARNPGKSLSIMRTLCHISR